MFSWKRPANLGVKDGRLAPCKRTPNCVSSQADPADRDHHIAPIAFRGSMQELRRAAESMERTKLMRYVDDLELYYDEKQGLVHVRSASRLGRRDFGVNRNRVEALRRIIGRT